MLDRIKEHNKHIRLACTQASYILEHAYKGGLHLLWIPVKEAIYRRFHPNIAILKKWIPTVKKHNNTHGTKIDAWKNNFKIEM